MSVVDWLAMTVLLALTLVMLIHIGKLGAALKADDHARMRALNRQTMWMVGVWQIVLGLTLTMFNLDQDDGSWMPVITLCGSGVGIILLDQVARKFEIGTWER